MAYDVIEPEKSTAKGYDVIEPESKGYDVIESDTKASTASEETISQLGKWPALKMAVQEKLEKVFPGMAEKGSPSPISVLGNVAMIAPLGVPERLGKLVMGYFAAKTAYDQPAIYRQIKEEIKSENYSAAQRTAIEDVLQIGIMGSGVMAMKTAPKVEPTIGEVLAPKTTEAVKKTIATPPPKPTPKVAAEPVKNIQDVVPAIETMTGELKPADKGTSHNEAIEKHGLTAEDINKRTYMDVKTGEEVKPEQLAKAGLPTAHEEGKTEKVDRVHSDTLAKAQEQPVIPEKPPVKEMWQMTKAEYSAMVKKEYGMQGFPDLKAKQATDANHKAEVGQAIKDGEIVPPEVLADYPDLKPPEVKPAQPPATAKVGEVSKLPVYKGQAWRAASGYSNEKTATAADVLNFEETELGNEWPTTVPAGVREELKNVPARDVVWVARTMKAATRYGEPAKIQLAKDARIIYEDEDGALVLNQNPTPPPPAVTPGKVAAKPSAKQDAAFEAAGAASRHAWEADTIKSHQNVIKFHEAARAAGNDAEYHDNFIAMHQKAIRNISKGFPGKESATGELRGEEPTPQQGDKGADPIETLNTASQVKITPPKGSTMVRVTDKSGKVSVQDLKSVQGENVFKGADIKKIEAGTIGKDKKFVPVKGEVKISEFPKEQLSRGAGAAAGGEPGTYSAIQQMADQLEATGKENAPINERIDAIDKVKAKASDLKDGVKSTLANVLAIKNALWDSYSKLAPYTEMKSIVGKWFYANQRADFEAREFGKQIVKAVPNKIRREAITNWIQADGDAGVLKDRAAASKGSLKRGYEAAQNLTPRETEIAQMIREYYDKQLEKGINEGLLKEGLENYITQVWKKENPITRKLMNDLVNSKLQPNFKYARQRMFSSYFEGEQAGFKPSKDAGALVANYDQSFNKSLAARAFIKDLHEGTASDGRPLVEVSGSGKLVGEGEPKPKFIIKPKSTPDDIGDYKTIDHPALRGWKWLGKTPEGADVMMQGELKVHPEIYDKLKNRLSTSWFRQHPVPRGLLNVQSTLKQSMMSISGFHQVQENLHSLGHRINPLNLEKLDFSEPVTKSLVEHGLQLADYNALSDFGEGLSSGKLISKIPVVGSKLQAYNDWLFQENIPRLKLTMAKRALERNKERYAGAIAQGKITPDQVLELTSSQANHAFGELPYKYWGRNPNLQDFYRTFLLAPDFLEARAGFVGQALKPGGLGAKGLLKNEQVQALALLALTQYITARIANQIIDKDPHWELKNAFRIISGSRAYSLRTVPGDVIHLLSDPRGFTYNRLSPMIGRGGIELATQRDYRGVKRGFFDQMKDLLKSGIPISFNRKNGESVLESFGNAFGVQNQRYDAVQNIQQRAQDFKSATGIKDTYETIYNADEDKFKALRDSMQEGNQKSMQKEFTKLKQTTPPSKIREHFKLSLSRPFTGSKANDIKFYNSLDEQGKAEFQEAKDLRRARIAMIESLQ